MPKSAFGPPDELLWSPRIGSDSPGSGNKQFAFGAMRLRQPANVHFHSQERPEGRRPGLEAALRACRIAGQLLARLNTSVRRSRPNLWEKVIVLYACEKFVLGLWKNFRVRYFILGLWASFRVGYSKSRKFRNKLYDTGGGQRHNNISYSHFESKELKTFSRTFELQLNTAARCCGDEGSPCLNRPRAASVCMEVLTDISAVGWTLTTAGHEDPETERLLHMGL